MARETSTDSKLGLILATYLVGLLIGGLYVGMVSPARTVVQADFGIDDTVGIWMINIYTLFYAALIPIIGKIADRRGRKRVFTICVGCVGAIICGLSKSIGGFGLLLVGRVLQAAGAGGMLPVANAEIGASFPEEKRGMALGMAAAVAGVSNVLGAVAGSAVVGAFGIENWPALFYLCVPFCIAIIVVAVTLLPDSEVDESHGRMDIAGSILFALFVLLLLLGLKNIDFASFSASATQPSVLAPLLAAIAAVVAFRTVEAMGDPVGSGGYYVLAIGLTSFITTPVGGKLIDKLGPKPVLITGLAISTAGLAYLALIAVTAPSFATFVIGLAIVGAGMGMSMGAPTNYMILENTDKAESSSAIATITLIRQIGTSIAPAIYVGLITSTPGLAGYQHMLFCVALFNVAALITMLFYQPKR